MKPSTRILLRLLLALFTFAACGPLHAFCFKEAADRYKVNEALLRAIAKTESNFKPMARNKNTNGTSDIGVMQINTWWLPTLKKFGIGRKELDDPCTNVNIGAWVLAHNIAQYGDTWKAVGAYNATTPSKQAIYVEKVWRNLIEIMKKDESV